MVDVSQSIAFAIFQQRQKTGQVEGALRDLLTGKRLSERRLQRLAEVGLGGAGGPSGRSSSARGLPGTPLPVTPFYEEETEEAWLAQGRPTSARCWTVWGTRDTSQWPRRPSSGWRRIRRAGRQLCPSAWRR